MGKQTNWFLIIDLKPQTFKSIQKNLDNEEGVLIVAQQTVAEWWQIESWRWYLMMMMILDDDDDDEEEKHNHNQYWYWKITIMESWI